MEKVKPGFVPSNNVYTEHYDSIETNPLVTNVPTKIGPPKLFPEKKIEKEIEEPTIIRQEKTPEISEPEIIRERKIEKSSIIEPNVVYQNNTAFISDNTLLQNRRETVASPVVERQNDPHISSDQDAPSEVGYANFPTSEVYNKERKNFKQLPSLPNTDIPAKEGILGKHTFFKMFCIITLLIITILGGIYLQLLHMGVLTPIFTDNESYSPTINVDSPVTNNYDFKPQTDNIFKNNFTIENQINCPNVTCNCV